MDFNDKKYKDRDPKDTINIITKFFENRGIRINIDYTETEIGTYGCYIQLFYGDLKVGHANGKGMTKEFSLASGLGEMYERFCSRINYIFNDFITDIIKDYNFKNFGYKLEKDEKILSFEDFYNEPLFYNYAKRIIDKDDCLPQEEIKDQMEKIYYCLMRGGESIGLRFNNVISGEPVWVDPKVLIWLETSRGLVCGNTYEEAFNQGFSEVIEKYLTEEVFFADDIEFCAIDEKYIDNPDLRKKLQAIKDCGHDYYVIDLSYHYGAPVILGILVDKKLHHTQINYGAFPVFDIAVERTITEMYQNVVAFNKERDLLQTPIRNMDMINYLYRHVTGLSYCAFVPKDFFKHLKLGCDYNKQVFLPKNSTNKEIYDYFIDFIKRNNLDVYVKDNSLCKDMYSLHIFVRNAMIGLPINEAHTTKFLEETIDKVHAYKTIQDMIRNRNFSVEKMKENYFIFKDDEDNLFTYLMYRDPSALTNQSMFVLELMEQQYRKALSYTDCDYEYLCNFNWAKPFEGYGDIKKYLTIIQFKKFNNYTDEELLEYLPYFGFDVSQEDLDNWNNIHYILLHSIIIPESDIYNTDNYKNMALSLI